MHLIKNCLRNSKIDVNNINFINFNILLICFKATNWVFHTGRICHVWCNFWLGYKHWTTIFFGTLKDSSLKIDSLPFLSGKNTVFDQKNHFFTFWTMQFGPNPYQIMYGETFRLSVSAFATVTLKSFNGKFAVKIDFLMVHFMLPLLTLTLEV